MNNICIFHDIGIIFTMKKNKITVELPIGNLNKITQVNG